MIPGTSFWLKKVQPTDFPITVSPTFALTPAKLLPQLLPIGPAGHPQQLPWGPTGQQLFTPAPYPLALRAIPSFLHLPQQLPWGPTGQQLFTPAPYPLALRAIPSFLHLPQQLPWGPTGQQLFTPAITYPGALRANSFLPQQLPQLLTVRVKSWG